MPYDPHQVLLGKQDYKQKERERERTYYKTTKILYNLFPMHINKGKEKHDTPKLNTS